MFSRRGFLKRIGAAAVALTLARHLPGIAGAQAVLAVPEQHSRADVLYGWAGLRPQFAVIGAD